MTSSMKAKLTFKYATTHQCTMYKLMHHSWILIKVDSNYNLIHCVTETVLDYMHDITCVITLIWMHQLEQGKLKAVTRMLSYDLFTFRNIWEKKMFGYKIGKYAIQLLIIWLFLYKISSMLQILRFTFLFYDMQTYCTRTVYQFTYCLFVSRYQFCTNIERQKLKTIFFLPTLGSTRGVEKLFWWVQISDCRRTIKGFSTTEVKVILRSLNCLRLSVLEVASLSCAC